MANFDWKRAQTPRKTTSWWLTVVICLMTGPTHAQPIAPVIGHRNGYLESVQDEREMVIREVILPPRAKPAAPKASKILIFSPELKQEFTNRYRQEFGRTDIAQNVDAPDRFTEIRYDGGVRVTIQQDVERKQKFGEYMIKRLGEHQVDEYFRSSPVARPVYEMKERVSNLNVAVKGGYEFKFNYSYSGNTLNLHVENPYKITNQLTFQMDPEGFGPTGFQETIFFVRVPFEKGVSVETDFRLNEGIVSLVGRKRLSKNLFTALTGTTSTGLGLSQNFHRILLGMTWIN